MQKMLRDVDGLTELSGLVDFGSMHVQKSLRIQPTYQFRRDAVTLFKSVPAYVAKGRKTLGGRA